MDCFYTVFLLPCLSEVRSILYRQFFSEVLMVFASTASCTIFGSKVWLDLEIVVEWVMKIPKKRIFTCIYPPQILMVCMYTVLHMFRQVLFGAGNQGNHQNFEKSLLTNKLWHVFMGMKQKKNFFFEKKIQNGRLKKTEFFNFAKSWAISAKISWIGPWVSRIDWCPSHQSILLTQGPIHEIFTKKFWELAILKNEIFFESAILNFFFWKKKFFFCFIPMKISPNLYGRMDGSKFWCFPWFPENSSLCVILRYTV